ncbi:MAG: hypothetical protein ABI411_14655 [Tahibacter sp.]
MSRKSIFRSVNTMALFSALLSAQPFADCAYAAQIDIPGPAGSVAFGRAVKALPNGNIVVTDPAFTDPSNAILQVGAVYLLTPVGSVISRVTGGIAGDHVGSGEITVLSNGNFVIESPDWHNGPDGNSAGAVTWGSATVGLTGVVSAANSLVGAAGDRLADLNQIYPYRKVVYALVNGNYVVRSPHWHNDVGAVTWGNGNIGTFGPVSAANSLVGSTTGDVVGSGLQQAGGILWDNVAILSNGNYVVSSPQWDNGSIVDAGAVTWGDGTAGTSGVVSAANSLVGSTTGDYVGFNGAAALSNGNYVVASPAWHNGLIVDAGAATWGNGAGGIHGPVTALNSLVGTMTDSEVGYPGVIPLSNGNYVVASDVWDNATTANAGAATWANGETGLTGPVSAGNSLVGTKANDFVGSSVRPLSNGNYLVQSPLWDNGAAVSAGAATWANGATGLVGVVSVANSLVGTTTQDYVGDSVTPLSNGNYVVTSSVWHNSGMQYAGAVTWGNGSGGSVGVVSAANSLVGTAANDEVGNQPSEALSNGHYVVASPYWHGGGAATWGDGNVGTSGPIATANSFLGLGENYASITALSNGNYVVRNESWNNGALSQAGAVAWVDGRSGVSGQFGPSNALLGVPSGFYIGAQVVALSNGDYVISSPSFSQSMISGNLGAVTLGRGRGGLVGVVDATNSVIGTIPGSYPTMSYSYDPVRDQLVVGQPRSHLISLFKADQLFADGLD